MPLHIFKRLHSHSNLSKHKSSSTEKTSTITVSTLSPSDGTGAHDKLKDTANSHSDVNAEENENCSLSALLPAGSEPIRPKSSDCTPEQKVPLSDTTIIHDEDRPPDNKLDAVPVEAPLNIDIVEVKLSRTEEKLDELDENIDTINDAVSQVQNMYNAAEGPVKELLDATNVTDIIEEKLQSFADSLPVFMSALDEIGKLHPFISVAVLAFKAVYVLESTRRENDKKIALLYVEMKDMLSVLLRMKDMKDFSKEHEDRLRQLSDQTADDIKACANACNTYSKKKLVVKFIRSTVWEQRLASFTGTFTQRRGQFEFELTLRSTEVGTATYSKVAEMQTSQQEMQKKIDVMLSLFQKVMSPEQAGFMQKYGSGATMEQDEAQIKKILAENPSLISSDGHQGSGGAVWVDDMDKKDMDATVKELTKKSKDTRLDELLNMESFDRKFAMQTRQLKEEMELIVVRESDRVIEAITSGPKDRIVDKDIYAVWDEGGWKGSVKARHFVMALRDFYQEKAEVRMHSQKKGVHAQRDPDEWTLPYIDVSYVQPILEALDDDASGFITISEVNKFSAARPKGWSLRRWIAYWAIGTYMTMRTEQDRIFQIYEKMFGMLPTLLDENRPFAQNYLNRTWRQIYEVVSSLQIRFVPDELEPKFRSYAMQEEARLKNNLAEVRYFIDQFDVLHLVVGPGRIERYFFTLVRLILEHHLDVFRVCRMTHINGDELFDAVDTVLWVMDAVNDRYNNLKCTSDSLCSLETYEWITSLVRPTAVFINQHLDLKQAFKVFGFGIYSYLNDPADLWVKDIHEQFLEEENFEEGNESKISRSVLFYPEYNTHIDYAPYEEMDDCTSYMLAVSLESETVCPITPGDWCHIGYKESWPNYTDGMMYPLTVSDQLHASQSQEFKAIGVSAYGQPLTLIGTWAALPGDKNTHTVNFRIYEDKSPKIKYFYCGTLDVSTSTISGSWGISEDVLGHDGTFILKRGPPCVFALRPPPSAFDENKSRALWIYATSVVVDQVRTRLWSWSRMKARRDHRMRWSEFAVRDQGHGDYLSNDERKEYNQLKSAMTYRDAWYYIALVRRETAKLVLKNVLRNMRSGYFCDICDEQIATEGPDGRISCLDCRSKEDLNTTVDFCTNPNCLEATISIRQRTDLMEPHLPTHDVMKVRGVVLLRQYLAMRDKAKSAIERAQEQFKFVAPPDDISVAGTITQHATRECNEDDEAINPGDTKNSSNMCGDESKNDRVIIPDNALESSGFDEEWNNDVHGINKSVDDKSTMAENNEHDEEDESSESKGGISSGSAISTDVDQEVESVIPCLDCAVCKEPVERPCWYCMDCEDDVFICFECDSKGGHIVYDHKEDHYLVRCRDISNDKDGPKLSLEDTVSALSQKIDIVAENVQNMDCAKLSEEIRVLGERQTRVEDFIKSMDERQARVEDMLRLLLTRLVENGTKV